MTVECARCGRSVEVSDWPLRPIDRGKVYCGLCPATKKEPRKRNWRLLGLWLVRAFGIIGVAWFIYRCLTWLGER